MIFDFEELRITIAKQTLTARHHRTIARSSLDRGTGSAVVDVGERGLQLRVQILEDVGVFSQRTITQVNEACW